jgi:hypothetical protein
MCVISSNHYDVDYNKKKRKEKKRISISYSHFQIAKELVTKMKTPSSTSTNIDETRSRTSEIINTNNRQSRRSHVSGSSNQRQSVNTSGTHSTKIKQGMFHRAVPQMPRALAFFCFILNLILPGTGMSVF